MADKYPLSTILAIAIPLGVVTLTLILVLLIFLIKYGSFLMASRSKGVNYYGYDHENKPVPDAMHLEDYKHPNAEHLTVIDHEFDNPNTVGARDDRIQKHTSGANDTRSALQRGTGHNQGFGSSPKDESRVFAAYNPQKKHQSQEGDTESKNEIVTPFSNFSSEKVPAENSPIPTSKSSEQSYSISTSQHNSYPRGNKTKPNNMHSSGFSNAQDPNRILAKGQSSRPIDTESMSYRTPFETPQGIFNSGSARSPVPPFSPPMLMKTATKDQFPSVKPLKSPIKGLVDTPSSSSRTSSLTLSQRFGRDSILDLNSNAERVFTNNEKGSKGQSEIPRNETPSEKAANMNYFLYDTPKSGNNGVVANFKGSKYKVQQAHRGRLTDELDIQPGDAVQVFEVFDDGWCRAVITQAEQGIQSKRILQGVCPISSLKIEIE